MSRPEHMPQGDPCAKCKRKASAHRHRIRNRSQARQEYFQAYDKKRKGVYRYRHRIVRRNVDHIIGVDGEGQGRFPHRYTYLAAANEANQCWHCHNKGKALSTVQCLDFFLSLPSRSLVVGFALGYDWTKILTDVPNKLLYMLYHEEKRAWRDNEGKIRYKQIKWRGYRLDYMNRRFTVAKDGRRVTIWDIWRFFQGKFTKALQDWKVGTKEAIAEIARMKDQRATFDKLKAAEVQAYCRDECYKLASLTRSLITAHCDAGLQLKSYYGAGSTASALLNKHNIKECLRKPPRAMWHAIACAFFGGRFENGYVGPIRRKIYVRDIASAYPYQITLLPCLLHGRWTHVINPKPGQLERARLALIKWQLRPTGGYVGGRFRPAHAQAWGPLPVRQLDGTIVFPIAAKGGWCWKQEYLEAARIFSNTTCSEAWLYHTDCDCQPFKDIPYYYNERCKLGSGGMGDIYKLGPNSVYGKLAQSKGVDPPFQSFTYAGNITSGTRAQLLSSFEPGEDLWHVVMFATDSVASTRPLQFPAPLDTGTSSATKNGRPVPLGSWDEKTFPKGIFCVRPGIWFPIDPTDEDLKEVRARGLGKKILYEQWQNIQEQWEKTGSKKPLVVTGRHSEDCHCGKCPEGLTRFVGAKSALSSGKKSGIKRSPNYGEWVPHTIQVSFSPKPKREKILADGRLKLWDYVSEESVPYDRALEHPEIVSLGMARDMLEEQPDLDISTG